MFLGLTSGQHVISRCSDRGMSILEACTFNPGTKEKCIPNNKYAYLPEGFACYNVPNTPKCKIVCVKGCGQLMEELATDHPNGLSSTSLTNPQCKHSF